VLAGHWRHADVNTMTFHDLVEIHEAMAAQRENERRWRAANLNA
jgi:hypothetical protein